MKAIDFVMKKVCPLVESIDTETGFRIAHGPVGSIGIVNVDGEEIIFGHRKMPHPHNVVFGICTEVDAEEGKLHIKRIPPGNKSKRQKIRLAVEDLMPHETLFVRDPL